MFRAAVRVLELVVVNEAPSVVTVVQRLQAWYAAVCAHPTTPEYFTTLQHALERLMEALEPFETVGVNLHTPKLHRAKDVATVVRNFGGAQIASTDTYEMAHKTLKKIFARCVANHAIFQSPCSFAMHVSFFVYALF